MYKRRFAEWGVFKNIREQDVPRLREDIANYRAEHNASPVELHVNGTVVEADRVKRSLIRHERRVRKNSNESRTQDVMGGVEFEVLSGDSSDDSVVAENCSLQLTPFSDTTASDASPEEPRCPVVSLTRHQTGVVGDLTSAELTGLSIAVLQADYHLGELRLAGRFMGADQAFTTSAFGFQPVPYVSPTVSTVRPSVEMLDLESILYQSNRYYDSISAKRRKLPSGLHQCSGTEVTQARDFYARHWAGLILGAGARSNLPLAWKLLDGVWDQTRHVLRDDHPHFLPWICFVICYPRDWVSSYRDADYLQAKTLGFAQWMTESVGGRDDPRFIIQQKLQRSCHQRDLALILLRQIVNRFLSDTQNNYAEELQVLAQLFRHIDQVAHLDAAEIEATLASWAGRSLDLAKVIHEESLTGMYNMKSPCVTV
jgi:hypothetical protein